MGKQVLVYLVLVENYQQQNLVMVQLFQEKTGASVNVYQQEKNDGVQQPYLVKDLPQKLIQLSVDRRVSVCQALQSRVVCPTYQCHISQGKRGYLVSQLNLQ